MQMPDGARAEALKPRMAPALPIAFERRKYGRDLLVDVCDLAGLPRFIADPVPHRLAFHEITLLSAARGCIDIDGVAFDLSPCTIVFTGPGQHRRWRLAGPPQGHIVIFESECLRERLSDARVLDRMPYFAAGSARRPLTVAASEFSQVMALVVAMREEVEAGRRDACELLSAMLYELLLRLRRAYPPDATAAPSAAAALHRCFLDLVDAHFLKMRHVSQYAERIGTTRDRLNRAVRACSGSTASAVIHARINLEARRWLLHSDASIAGIADGLGFSDASYFNRFFKRHSGATPREFRRQFALHDHACAQADESAIATKIPLLRA